MARKMASTHARLLREMPTLLRGDGYKIARLAEANGWQFCCASSSAGALIGAYRGAALIIISRPAGGSDAQNAVMAAPETSALYKASVAAPSASCIKCIIIGDARC